MRAQLLRQLPQVPCDLAPVTVGALLLQSLSQPRHVHTGQFACRPSRSALCLLRIGLEPDGRIEAACMRFDPYMRRKEDAQLRERLYQVSVLPPEAQQSS